MTLDKSYIRMSWIFLESPKNNIQILELQSRKNATKITLQFVFRCGKGGQSLTETKSKKNKTQSERILLMSGFMTFPERECDRIKY